MNHSHNKRNTKTSLLLTISLAYLIFGGSSLLLIANLILKGVQNFVGTDILATAALSDNYLPEKNLRELLDSEKNKSHPFVYDYTFRGVGMDTFFKDNFDTWLHKSIESRTTSIHNNINLSPVEINYLNASLTEFFIPNYVQKGINYPKINGKPDLIWSLYSDEGTSDKYENNQDIYQIVSKNISESFSKNQNNEVNPTEQIKILIPLGMQSVLSDKGGDENKLIIGNNYHGHVTKTLWRDLIRGLPKKMPGFEFYSYKQVQFFLRGIISFDQMKIIFENIVKSTEDGKAKKHYQEHIHEFNGLSNDTYFYPKVRLMVKIYDYATEEDRDYLT